MFTNEIDATQRCYIIWINDSEHFDIIPKSIAISKSLFNMGFEFCSIATSGGTDEISHSGTRAYDVKYTDFSAFENNFKNDLSDASNQVRLETGGWVSSMNYDDISLYLKKGAVRIRVVISKDKRILINAYEFDNSFDIECVIKNINEVIAKPVKIEQYPCYIEVEPKDEISKYFDKRLLSFWKNATLN